MKIAYFGSSIFSVPPLEAIARSVSCVVTKAGKTSRPGYILEDNEVKKTASALHLPYRNRFLRG